MKQRYERNVRILNDILGYCHYLDCNEFKVDFLLDDGGSRITVYARIDALPPGEIKRMETFLNVPRQHEVEQHYWNISGIEEIDNELTLAGIMVDKANVSYENDILTIAVERFDLTPEE